MKKKVVNIVQDMEENFGDILGTVKVDYFPFPEREVIKSSLSFKRSDINFYLSVDPTWGEAIFLKWLSMLLCVRENKKYDIFFMSSEHSKEANLLKELYSSHYRIINKEKMELLLLKHWKETIRLSSWSAFNRYINSEFSNIPKVFDVFFDNLATKTNVFCSCYPNPQFVTRLKEETVKIVSEEIVKVSSSGVLSKSAKKFYEYLFNKSFMNFLDKIKYHKKNEIKPFQFNFRESQFWFLNDLHNNFCFGTLTILATIGMFVYFSFLKYALIVFAITILVALILSYKYFPTTSIKVVKEYFNYVFNKKDRINQKEILLDNKDRKQIDIDSVLVIVLKEKIINEKLLGVIKSYLNLKRELLDKTNQNTFNNKTTILTQLNVYLLPLVEYIFDKQEELTEEDEDRIFKIFNKANAILENLIAKEDENKQVLKDIDFKVSEQEIDSLLKEVSSH